MDMPLHPFTSQSLQPSCTFDVSQLKVACPATLNVSLTLSFLSLKHNSIGSVLGFILSNVLLSGVVGSALNTVLVCFAAGPFEFHKNHALLSEEMRDVWSQHVWEQSV